jgi:ribosome-associated protein
MQLTQLKKLVLDSLENSKARDVVALDVRHLTDITDYMIICSGTSNRHTRTIADHLAVKSKSRGVRPLSVEGEETGEWVLVDLADIIVHIMLPETREFYSLEKLWSVPSAAKPAPKTAKKAAKPAKKAAPAAKPAKRTAAKPAAKKVAARKPAAKAAKPKTATTKQKTATRKAKAAS